MNIVAKWVVFVAWLLRYIQMNGNSELLFFIHGQLWWWRESKKTEGRNEDRIEWRQQTRTDRIECPDFVWLNIEYNITYICICIICPLLNIWMKLLKLFWFYMTMKVKPLMGASMNINGCLFYSFPSFRMGKCFIWNGLPDANIKYLAQMKWKSICTFQWYWPKKESLSCLGYKSNDRRKKNEMKILNKVSFLLAHRIENNNNFLSIILLHPGHGHHRPGFRKSKYWIMNDPITIIQWRIDWNSLQIDSKWNKNRWK